MKTIGRTATKEEKQRAIIFFKTKTPKPITSSMSKDEALTQQMINQFRRY